ncbi:MAG: hypothetical protein EPO40_01665 [Myxococcaceae bacterium]|nr:MAG: hypothetical protein EPO40_01665 [Myxococcaceae bacterium]
MQDSPGTSVRVLALVLHPGCSGHVVVDGYGVVPRSFRMRRVSHHRVRYKARALRRLLTQIVRRFAPTRAVLGVSRRDDRASQALRTEASRVFDSLQLPFVVRGVHLGVALVVRGARGDRPNTLATRLVEGFTPELAPHLEQTEAVAWYHRAAWHSTALAIAELVERAPMAAAALARPAAFMMGRFHANLLTSLRHSTPRV